jgi:hypothetical protein
MPLLFPKYFVLDSASLGKASQDYWSQEKARRDKARTFLSQLLERGIHVTFTLTHVCELLRHNDKHVVNDRLGFLRAIPLIAWLQPYTRHWFPGSIVTLFQRELHAVIHGRKQSWREIIESVRADIWQTGTGSEMFVENDRLWRAIRIESQRQQLHDQFVASVARTDAGNVSGLTVRESQRLPKRSRDERIKFGQRFAKAMTAQLQRHGDHRLDHAEEAAIDFATKTLSNVSLIEAAGSDPILGLLNFHDIPADLVTPEMTIQDVGDLGVYIKQLKLCAEDLNPPATVTVRDVPPTTLPSYVLQQRLAAIQRKAERVSGSDLGDASIAPLILYSDAVEVDKRTGEFLNQLQRSDASLANLMGPFFRSGDYAEAPAWNCERG